jgi:RsiW-degrading membrane proteinase PrsW (M82 family)
VIELTKALISLVPVFVFLVALIVLDSFKLVRISNVLWAIAAGCLAAVVCLFVNRGLLDATGLSLLSYQRYVSPVVEELAKAAYLVFLIRSRRVGFIVDTAILGFAVGAGFAMIENVYYLHTITSTNLLLWVVRGFGTAIIHGGSTAIFGMVAKGMSDRKAGVETTPFIVAWLVAVVIHSIFNHFILPPWLTTIVVLMSFVLMTVVVFDWSEKSTRRWLGVGMDTDLELLEMVKAGEIHQTRIGDYLQSLKKRFPGEIVGDMLCLIRVHLELSLTAKGTMLLRGAGFKVSPDPQVRAKLEELRYLERSIGPVGRLALSPVLRTSSRDLWQLYMLKK